MLQRNIHLQLYLLMKLMQLELKGNIIGDRFQILENVGMYVRKILSFVVLTSNSTAGYFVDIYTQH